MLKNKLITIIVYFVKYINENINQKIKLNFYNFRKKKYFLKKIFLIFFEKKIKYFLYIVNQIQTCLLIMKNIIVQIIKLSKNKLIEYFHFNQFI